MKRIDPARGEAALRAALRDAEVPESHHDAVTHHNLLTAVRWTLGLLAERHPGHGVEVRVPPAGAVQVLEGPAHRRGTPPNVVETTPGTWIALAAGRLSWDDALHRGLVAASGIRADLSGCLPVVTLEEAE